jgi:hypothetical protein
MSMIAKRLALGLMIGAGLLAGAASVRAGDTILLKRTKDDAPAQQLQRDTGDADVVAAHWRGRVGHYYGYRPYYGGFYRYGYYPRVYVGVYSVPRYYASPVYYPSYYYTYPSVSISTYYPISHTTPAGSSPSFRPNTEQLPAPTPVGSENLPPPRKEVPQGRQTFPYDGGPQAPVPMPLPDPAGQTKPPADPSDEGKIVSLPAKDKLAYPAYGDKPVRDERTVVTRNDGKK